MCARAWRISGLLKKNFDVLESNKIAVDALFFDIERRRDACKSWPWAGHSPWQDEERLGGERQDNRGLNSFLFEKD